MSRWIALLESQKRGGEALPKLPKGGFDSNDSALPPRVSGIARLRELAKVAGCPDGYVTRLHPTEIAEYAHYPDAEVVRSLRHLAKCRECLARQCRPVTCATCAAFVPNVDNPQAGVGHCSIGFGGDGPPAFPDAPRHCEAWRAAQ